MKKRLLLPGLVALLVGTVVLVITGYMRLLAVPLFLVFSTLRLLFDSLPQRLLWFGMLALAVPVIWRSLGLGAMTLLPQQGAADQLAHGRVGEWLELLQNARETTYQKWELAQQLRQLVLQVLSEQEGLPSQQIWRRLDNGTLAISPEVLLLLRVPRIIAPSQQHPSRAREQVLERQIAATVEYLNDKLTSLAGASE